MDSMQTCGGIHRWSTDSVPQAQRLDYWVGAICEGFLEMSATSPEAPRFFSSLESAPLGPVGVNRVRGSAQDVYRTRSAIARSRDNYFYLLCKTDSAWSASQGERTARMLPGDAVLVDSRDRYAFHFPVSADTVSLELPPAWVEAWLPTPSDHVGRRIDGQSGWGQTLCSFARQLTPEVAAAPPLPAALLSDQLGALLALASGSGIAADEAPPAGAGARAAMRERVQHAIRERHAESGLTAAAIAAQLGLSERSLHRCLAEGQQSFAGLLMDCRMAVARRLLSEPRFDRLGIAEIGRRVGLADASHFVRLCKRYLGATPGALRRSC